MPTINQLIRTPRVPQKSRPKHPAMQGCPQKRGKRLVWIQPETEDGKTIGEEREHAVPAGSQLRVHTGEYVKAGDPLVYGPLVPHDILRVTGAEAVQDYMVREVQAVYRSQRVDIDDKHIEIIVAQMLRKVKVTKTGDTGMLPWAVMDKFAFQEVNRRLIEECVKVVDPAETSLPAGRVVSRDAYEEERANAQAAGARKKNQPTAEVPEQADFEIQLLGITKAAVQSDSFISAASFQETTKVLTEAALASKVDYLVGLKENVILGHLIPAGTGFKTHQEAEVRINLPEGHPQYAAAHGAAAAAAPAEAK